MSPFNFMRKFSVLKNYLTLFIFICMAHEHT